MKLSRLFSPVLILVLFLTACAGASVESGVQPVIGMPEGSDGFPWWNDSVFYEVFVRSFYDSNGDGIGDLAGLIEKLDYLNDGDPKTTSDLGVTGLWLMPIHPAASYHGYDVTDYYSVNPEYGTMEDFKRLISEAHERGVRILIDLVLNHTSSQHPWFLAAQDPASEYRDWYVWSETEPTGSGWHASPSGFYYGIFWEGMPDLNYANPAVTSQMQDVARFWLEEVGVDGFRLDAAKHLLEDGTIQAHAGGTHEWLKVFRDYYKQVAPQAITVGEVWDASPTVSKYVAGDELDLAFSFDLAQAMVTSARVGRAQQAANILKREMRLFKPGQFATFLTNHDQDRAMLLFGREAGKAKIAASMMLSAPGVPFIYYGEEIGMIGKKPDEQIRTPMQWTDGQNAGFSTGIPWIDLNADYTEGVNVASESDDPASLLSHYQALVRVRNQHVALRTGEYVPVESGHEAVLAFLRISINEKLLVVINLGDSAVQDYRLSGVTSLPAGAYQGVPIFGGEQVPEFNVSPGGSFEDYQPQPELVGFSTLIIQLNETQ